MCKKLQQTMAGQPLKT